MSKTHKDVGESIGIAILIIAIFLFFLLLVFQNFGKVNVVGESYVKDNKIIISYDTPETMMHEICHVFVEQDKQDYFNDNNMQELCKNE